MQGVPNTRNIKEDTETEEFIVYCIIRNDEYELSRHKNLLQAIRQRDHIIATGGFEKAVGGRLKHHGKHYHKRGNKYVISKLVNGKQQTFGTYDTREEASKMVRILWKYDWDKSRLPEEYQDKICRKPKYYTLNKNRYKITYQNKSYGSYETEEEAKEMVEELKKVDWDINRLPYMLKRKIIKKPKYYTYNNGSYAVQKQVNDKRVNFGHYKTEAEAKEIVMLLKSVNWDVNQLSDEEKQRLSIFQPRNFKNYTYDKSTRKYNVYKTIDKKYVTYAKLDTEEAAQKMVEQLEKVDWDKDKLPPYYKRQLVRRPKHYGYNKRTGKWRVYKQINGKHASFGEYGSETTAKRIVEKLIANDWNKECLQNA